MAISSPPAIPIDRRVRRVTLDQWDAYTDAAVKMYTEEIGVSPVQGSPAGYRFYVRQLISSGRAFGILEGNRVLFKADLGSVSGSVCQVQGVWLEPELRGRGLAAPAMAAVVQLARTVVPTVSLYVNDYNLPARATCSPAAEATGRRTPQRQQRTPVRRQVLRSRAHPHQLDLPRRLRSHSGPASPL
jgi:predicted GNAT family acetyltransferase